MAERWRPRSLVLAAVVVLWASLHVNGQSRVRLVNNGYEEVVVGVSPNVREQDGPALVQALKDVFSATSRGLYQATDRRAYFRSVTILIPRSWSSVTVTEAARSENFENIDIRVDDMNPVYQHQPYTEQTGGCGDPGQYIHLTPSYLLNDTTAAWYGPRDKALLLEWAKLRWGVFDEIGYPNDPIYPPTYKGPSGYTPTLCANAPVPGRHLSRKRDRVTRSFGPEEQCCFVPNPQERQTATSSLLSYPSIMSDTVIHFCGGEGREHNTEAPTKQNFFCNGRSAWDVISDHPDFKDGANPAIETFPDVTVRVVQQADANYALVLDYSDSMNSHARVTKLRNTARRWLLHEVATGSSVAIINFNSFARMIRGLTRITDDASRRALADAIVNKGSGATSIGSGLRMAAKTVLANSRNPVILLITDGEENRDPRIDDVLDEVVASRVRVVTVAFGEKADQKLETVAEKTGGKTFTVQDTSGGQMLQDAFQGALTYQPPPPAAAQAVTIYDKEHRVSGSEESSTFKVDSAVGKKLTLTLETGAQAQVTSTPVLIGPDGNQYNAGFDSSSSSWTVIVDVAKKGEWRWKVGLSGQPGSSVSVRVTSLPRDPAVQPIRTRAWVNLGAKGVNAAKDTVIILAEVRQGNKPVIHADVRAIVTPPNENHQAQIYQLLDNGQGADTLANDGIYSRYMTKFSTPGRYGVKAQVTDGGTALINYGFHTARKRRRRQAEENTKDKKEYDAEEPVDEAHDNFFLDRPSVCCGSVVPVPKDAPTTGSFERIASGGSVKVNSVLQGDELPPARVRDLQVQLVGDQKVSGTFPALALITLSWTAPGDDWDSGIVSGYELRMTTKRSDLLEQNFIITNTNNSSSSSSSSSWHVVDLRGLPDDAEGGTPLRLHLSLSLPSATTYFALRAWDDVPLISEVSNIATLYIAAAPEPATLPIWAWVVIGVAALCLVAVLLVGLMVCMARKKSPESSRLLEDKRQK